MLGCGAPSRTWRGSLEIKLWPIERVSPYAKNPRRRPESLVRKVAASIQEFGWQQPLVVDAEGVLIVGHTRLEAARLLDLERVPVHVANLSPEKARAYRIADNRLAEEAQWDKALLAAELSEIDNYDLDLRLTGFDYGELEGLLAPDYGETPVERTEPQKRRSPLDLIFTVNGAGGFCCMAANSGWRYGVQSGLEGHRPNICPYHERSVNHALAFIDNDYFHYDHAFHLELVAEYRPKYATVRDIMSKSQCEAAGIAFYPREQIEDWAYELAEYAENVIVIPKYDCLDQIPEAFMLGYSVPTSHGGTPMPLSRFQGRRVHLLGGSWARQRAALAELGEDVASLDNNYLMKSAGYGCFHYPNGDNEQLDDLIPQRLVNPLYVCLALSLGMVAAEVNRLFPGSAPAAEPDDLSTVLSAPHYEETP